MLTSALTAAVSSVPTPASHAAPSEASSDSFANRLQQAREQRPAAAQRDAAAKPQAAKHQPVKAQGAKESAKKAEDARDADKPSSTEEHEDGNAADKRPPAASDLNQLLPGWMPGMPSAPTSPVSDAAKAADGKDAFGDGASPIGAGTAKLRSSAPEDAALATAQGHAGHPPVDLQSLAAAPDSQGKSGGQETLAADAGGVAHADPTPFDTLPAGLTGLAAPGHTAQPSALAGASESGATPFEAKLSAALGTPDFAPALGVQVSMLVREGVQQARLHLNPAEMGPIAVQIALDGSNAQVHFQADMAATREALQSSMPDLAAALQDGGFTLSGGGVSDSRQGSAQHSAQNAFAKGQADANANSLPGGVDTAVSGAQAQGRRTVARGVVDLYA